MEDIYDNQLYENASPPVMTDVVDCKIFSNVISKEREI